MVSTTIGIGFSHAANPQEAAFQACMHATNQLHANQVDLVFLFASPGYAKAEVLDTIASILKPKRLIGSSTGGIILPDGIADRGIAVLGINSEELRCGIAAVTNVSANNLRQAGFDLARKANSDLNLAQREAFIVFSDGIAKDNAMFVRGAQEVLGLWFPIIGAISSDDFKYNKLNQLFQNQILTDSAVGVLLGGGIQVALASKHGFKPLGKPRTITKVNEHVIRTIDNKPAVDIYEHFLGKEADNLKKGALASHAILYPLSIYLEDEREYLLRNAVDILPDGSIVCQGNIPEGAEVHLMISNKDACRRAAIDAAEEIKDALSGKQAKLVLIFESLARRKILGRSSFSEIQAIKDILGYTTPMIGMYSYGEIAPFGSFDNIKKTHLHNENILIVAIG